MRQAGVIAAAGLIALEKSQTRLHEDHKRAKRLADALAGNPGFAIDPAKVRTNILIFDCSKTGKTAVEWCDIFFKHGLWAQDTALYSVRFVTHCDVDDAAIERALAVLHQVAAQPQKASA